ncbi:MULTISPECIES: SHOCT domain-containing protein [unclassified Nocardioides]|uniref:SHOCT domain-containing protein n=1 Tax=unclassified Nocardioides TaxID=2615069 RepID=UPI0009EF90D3|nr:MULTISPECIES: SHOCT domain-containing protein [unclassified Nocardioides]GAW49866.1 uncharacterized protein PD653B2_2193 [Nocardioides sp. PD653-B2]GAW54622.1 uncharacterized protein PD653_2034 [Nocardioides sp. PD653]
MATDPALRTATGSIGGRPTRLELTADSFVVRLQGDAEAFRTVPLGRIVAVREQSGKLTGYLTVTTPGEDLQFSRVPRKDLLDFVEALRAGVAAAPPEEDLPTPEMAKSLETLEELERLGRLHSTGVITDEEFATAKAKMLDRL